MADDLARHLRGEPIHAQAGERGGTGLALVSGAIRGWPGWPPCSCWSCWAAWAASCTSSAGRGCPRRGRNQRGRDPGPARRASPVLPCQVAPQLLRSGKRRKIESLLKAEAHSERLLPEEHPDDVARRITLTRLRRPGERLHRSRAHRRGGELYAPGPGIVGAASAQRSRNRDYRTWLATTLEWEGMRRENGGSLSAGAGGGTTGGGPCRKELVNEQPDNVILLQHLAENHTLLVSLVKNRTCCEALLHPLEDRHDRPGPWACVRTRPTRRGSQSAWP